MLGNFVVRRPSSVVRRGAVVLVLLALVAPRVEAEEAPALKLDQVVAEALQNNPGLIAARERARAARHRVAQAGALEDPGLGFTYEDIPRDSLDPGAANEEMLFEISQEIPFPTKLVTRRLKAKREADQVQAEALAEEREVVARVKTAYYELYLKHAAIRLIRENVGLLKQFAGAAEARYASGATSQADVLKSYVEISKLENELAVVEKDRRTGEARLATLLNRSPEDVLGFPEAPVLTHATGLESLRDRALESRPELVAAKAQLARTRHEVSLAKMELLPDFEVAYAPVQTDRGSRFYGVMAKVMLPFWFWQSELPAIREAKANLRSEEEEYRSQENETLFELEGAWAKVKSARERLERYGASLLPQAKQVVSTTQAGYEAGRADFLDLIDAQRVWREVELSQVEAQVEYATSLAELERIVGSELKGVGGES